MKIIKIAAFIFALLGTSIAQATCYGSGTFRNCTDQSGNNYQIQHYGNTTTVQGYNARTGNNWNQTSNTYRNTTQTYGTAANGNSWNQTTTRIGNQTQTYGTDSHGNLFSKTCNQYGCY